MYDERIQWQHTGKEAAMEVTLPEMLEARERRAARQWAFLPSEMRVFPSWRPPLPPGNGAEALFC